MKKRRLNASKDWRVREHSANDQVTHYTVERRRLIWWLFDFEYWLHEKYQSSYSNYENKICKFETLDEATSYIEEQTSKLNKNRSEQHRTKEIYL